MSRLISRFNAYYAEKPSMNDPYCQYEMHVLIIFGSLDDDDHQRGKIYTRVLKESKYRATGMLMRGNSQVLGGIADTVAQSLTAIRQRALRKPGGVGKNDFLAIEIHELDEKNPLSHSDLIPPSSKLPPPFDFERLTRFMAYGFIMAPVQFKWFQFLSRAFPITKAAGLAPALKRVALDQLIFAPAGMLSQ